MSAQFKPGDRVRCIETWTTHVIDRGDEFTVDETARVLTGIDAGSNRVFVQGEWVPARYFEKVEPEFVVGQQVSGDDYTRLPVGSKVQFAKCDPLTKVAEDAWRGQGDGAHPDAEMASCVMPRTLTHLGAELADWERELLAEVDAEDKDDLYVEPEPLKEGDWVQVWAKFVREDNLGAFVVATPTGAGGEGCRNTYASLDAIVRPDAGRVPPWVKPARCTSLKEFEGGILKRCMMDAGHGKAYAKHCAPADNSPRVGVEWTAAEESGRITEGGAS